MNYIRIGGKEDHQYKRWNLATEDTAVVEIFFKNSLWALWLKNNEGGNMSEKKRGCMICGKPSEVSICDSCKAQIQGEAMDKKQKIEREVIIGPEVEKEKKKKREK